MVEELRIVKVEEKKADHPSEREVRAVSEGKRAMDHDGKGRSDRLGREVLFFLLKGVRSGCVQEGKKKINKGGNYTGVKHYLLKERSRCQQGQFKETGPAVLAEQRTK